MTIEVLDEAPFDQPAEQKQRALFDGLRELTQHHRLASAVYDQMVRAVFDSKASVEANDVAALPWLPVSIFKRLELRSVASENVIKTLMSSGTTGRAVSRIFLDADTARAQTRALVRIAGDFLGKARMPMVVIDDRSFLKDRAQFNARAAAILGFANLGRNHHYLLDEQLSPDWAAFTNWLNAQGNRPILLFGFTFIVWESFVNAAKRDGVNIRLPAGSVLVHGGGWKRLEERMVSSEHFKAALAETFGIESVHNYYGMVEQVGSIFFECQYGRLHTPFYADVVIRDPQTLLPMRYGEEGLIQVVSLLPRSYPGHSLLTEDLGTIHGEDDCPCGRMGKYFAVHGRIKNVEVRGCSDTRVLPAA